MALVKALTDIHKTLLKTYFYSHVEDTTKIVQVMSKRFN